jgi:hypothetical protein
MPGWAGRVDDDAMELLLFAIAVVLAAAVIQLFVRYELESLQPQPIVVRDEEVGSC